MFSEVCKVPRLAATASLGPWSCSNVVSSTGRLDVTIARPWFRSPPESPRLWGSCSAFPVPPIVYWWAFGACVGPPHGVGVCILGGGPTGSRSVLPSHTFLFGMIQCLVGSSKAEQPVLPFAHWGPLQLAAPPLPTLLFFKFYWSMVDLQHRVNFFCTAKWLSYTYLCVCIYKFFSIFFSIIVCHRILNVVPCAVQ